MKLTRAQIKESLKSVPMETILLGVHSAKQTGLTAKQIRFAEEIARGETKAGAYRKAYKSTGKPETQSKRGQELMKTGAVSAQVEAFQAAFEAQKYATPAHLRALTIHELTKHALDETFPPAQRMKALELLGKITEVALFTERREVVSVSNPAEIKEKLMASLRLAMGSDIVDVEATDGADLLAEIEQGRQAQADDAGADDAEPEGADEPGQSDPTHSPPPALDTERG
jgi:hypothetical protein